MSDADIESLVMSLRAATQLGRLNHDEAKAVVLAILAATAPKSAA